MSSNPSPITPDTLSASKRSKHPRHAGKLNKLSASMHERLRAIFGGSNDDKPRTSSTSLSQGNTTFDQGTNPEDRANRPHGDRSANVASTASLPDTCSEHRRANINDSVSARVIDGERSRNRSQHSTFFQSEVPQPYSLPQQNTASVLHGARDVNISGNAHFLNVGKQENFHQYVRGTFGLDILQPFVSFDAFHDSSAQDPHRRCHPGTRENVLKQMNDWIDNSDPNAPQMLWLHGPAGVGKSAIAQSISKSYGPGKVAATFFFFRSDPNRNDGNRLFPTLAWRLAKSIPGASDCIADALNKDWDIPRKAVEDQFEQLICQPLLSVAEAAPHAQVIVIDGVDECANEKLQQRILETIGKAVAGNHTPLRFLVCSRPESLIKETLDKFQFALLQIDLATLDDAYQDIEKYLRSEFSRIASDQDIPPATWPAEDVIRGLVSKSSGQFVYASTVIKFVGDEYSTATSQLDIILGLQPIDDDKSPFSELDTLYLEILQRQREPRFLKEFFALVVAGCSHEDYALLLSITKNGLRRKLRGLHSIFKFEPNIELHHRSFLDFLKEESRSRQYHPGRQTATRRYLELILEVLVRYANRAIEQPDYHGDEHFAPKFGEMIKEYPLNIELPLKDFEEVLSPLSRIKEESLKTPNASSPWKRGLCDQCIFFPIIDDLLLHLAFRRATLRVVAPCFQPEFENAGPFPLIPVGERVERHSEDLNSCLSLLLPLLRYKQEWESGALMDLLCELLRFEPSRTALKIQSISDAQNLIDAICHVARNERLKYQRGWGPHIAWNAQDATNLALEIYARIPLIPQLFLDGTAVTHLRYNRFEYQGRDAMVWRCSHYGITALCQRACIWGTLSHSNISPLLGILEDSEVFSFVFPLTEYGTLREWRQRATPSVKEIQERILEVAKAIQYIHSLGLVLDYPINWDIILLDSNCHAQIPPLCLALRYCHEASPEYRDFGNGAAGMCTYESGVLTFGCLFYEIFFDIDISEYERSGHSDEKTTTNRPDEPEMDENAWKLIQRCCAADPMTRPTMDQVVKEIEAWKLT